MAAAPRALPLALLLIAGGACGGDGGTTPEPPANPTPASISVLAGDGQSVPAGEPTPIPPAVIVRDGQGNPFRGATVQFSVAEGGGTLEGASPVTDASGVARVTSWTMGNAGPQRVAATVGSLSPASIEASIVSGTEILAEVVPLTGGVVTINTPGHPYEGLTLDVPPGAFPSAVDMRLRMAPNAQPPSMPAGYRVGGPALEITTDAPRSTQLMELEVPVQLQPGEAAVLVYFDPDRRVMEVLPTVAQSETSIRVITMHLRADLLLGPATASSVAPARAQSIGGAVTGHLMPIIHSVSQPSVPPLYDPSTSGWPVVDHGSAALPDGFGPMIPATQVMSSHLGLSPGASVKALSTPGFYADAGILASMQAAAQSPGITPGQLDAVFAKYAGSPKPLRDQLVQQNATASLALLNKPGFLALFKSATGPQPDQTWFATTVGANGGGLSISQAADPPLATLGAAVSGFADIFAKKTGDGPSTPVDGALPMSSFLFDFTKTSPVTETMKGLLGLTPAEKQVVNDQVRAALGLPTNIFQTEPAPGIGYTTHPGGPIPIRGDQLNLQAGGGGLDVSVYDLLTGLELTLGGGQNQGCQCVDIGQLVGPDNGANQDLLGVTFKKLGNLLRQMDAERLELVRARFSASPDTALIASDSTATFDADVPNPPDEGFRVRWDWGDGTTSENTDVTAATHHYDPPGDYVVTATLLSADGSRVLAVHTSYVKAPTSPHWRLTSMTDADALGWAASVPITVLLRDAIANPSSAMISLDDTPSGGTELQLRVLAGGTWTSTNCCTRFAPPYPGETRAPLGQTPTFVHSSFGWVWNGYKADYWNQSSTDLGAGTMFGQANLGSRSYNVRNIFGPDVQQGPEFVLRLDATRTGTTMVGTVNLLFWPIVDVLPGETLQFVEQSPDTYRFTFTAERIR